MILLISQDTYEESTNDLIDWLDYLGLEWERINGIDLHRSIRLCISNNDTTFFINDKEFNISHIQSVWIRRWMSSNNFDEILVQNNSIDSLEIANKINQHLNKENLYLIKYFYNELTKCKRLINRNGVNEISKLNVLNAAVELNILIPDTFIINNKAALKEISDKYVNKSFITKPIYNVGHIKIKNKLFLGYTRVVDVDDLNLDQFAPTLIQEKIEKEYEIRAFFVGDSFYSMAIFSQSNEQTKLDFRIYDYENPNRYCPYILDINLENKLRKLSKKLNIETGSFDLIKGKNGKIYFLEVNPEGQYGMVSLPCNYNLDFRIAKYLNHETN